VNGFFILFGRRFSPVYAEKDFLQREFKDLKENYILLPFWILDSVFCIPNGHPKNLRLPC